MITDNVEDKLVEDAQEGVPTLLRIPEKKVAKHVRKRWDRLERVTRERLAEIKVNYLRYRGIPFVQVHPNHRDRLWMPPNASGRRLPVINKIRRTVQRYVSQVTADEPVIEGVPASHQDEDRDAAESATIGMRSEWQRMRMKQELQRVVQIAAIMRSGFLWYRFDKSKGQTQPAQKFFPDEKGNDVLRYVDSKGNPVEHAHEAARIGGGDTIVSVMTPANVRWEGDRYAHDATEVMVGEIMSLGELYNAIPKSRELKVEDLLQKGERRPTESKHWLEDIRGESPKSAFRDLDDGDLGQTGDNIPEGHSLLDEPVLVINYYHAKDRMYPKGFHAIVAGKTTLFRGTLRYGMIPIAHLKFLDEIGDPMGLGLVDLLKDPQELLDFVNGQILRYLQMLKRRWFVPMHSGVKARDLTSPTSSVIEFNPQGGQPIPEVQPEIPNAMKEWVDRFDVEYDDQSGIHDTLQGKHVPGVSSGRHAEALRSGDETLLGLTRDQMQLCLEKSGEIILAILKKEWSVERRVRYMGENREYLEKSFRGTDFGSTESVQLKNGTLLMLTPAQRLETIMGWAAAGLLSPEEVRQLGPLGDVAGISISEDAHYQRARRQNARFLAGPSDKLKRARRDYEFGLAALTLQSEQVAKLQGLGMDQAQVESALGMVEDGLARIEEQWQEAVAVHAFQHKDWENRIEISRIHAIVHADALASDRTDSLPQWWVELFEEHATLEFQAGFPEQQPQPPAPEDIASAGNIETEPAGLNFGPGPPRQAVEGAAP